MNQDVEKHLLTLERELCEAVKKRNRVGAESVLADDFVATGHAGNFVDRAKYLEVHFSPQREFTIFDTSDQTVNLYHNAAVVMGEINIVNARMPDKHDPPKRYTAVYINREPKGWQCVAWQETPIQTAEKF